MSKILNYKFCLLFIILIIAAFLRLYNLTPTNGGLPPGLYPDEAIDGNNALEGFKVFYPENNGREGLFIDIQAVFLKVLMPLNGDNPEPWMLRIVSVVFGILTVLGVYFLAKELFNGLRENEILALLSSFFLAVSFWHINFSRISFRAIMAPAFLVWGLFLLLKALNQTKNNFQFSIFNFQSISKNFLLLSIIGGLIYGLGFHSYIAYRATPLLILIVLSIYWLQNKEKVVRKKIILVASGYTLMAIIVFAPLGIYFLKNPADFFGRTGQLSITHSASPLKDLGLNILKTAAMFNFVGDSNWRHNYAGRPELFLPVGILFLIGMFMGLKILFKKTPKEEHSLACVVLFSWLIIAALPVVISNEGIPHALRSLLMIPPVIILAGFGAIWFYKFVKNDNSVLKTKILNVSIFFFFLLLFFEAYYTYFIKWGKNYNVQGAFSADYVAIGRELNALPKEMPKYVVVQAGGVDVRGIPMPAQTVMYITNTFLPEKQKEKNIYYILPNQISEIPPDSYVATLK